jgi:membrane dipeptidase
MALKTTRRAFLAGALGAPFAPLSAALGGHVDYVADMHGHLFFFGPNTPATKPLARAMAAGNATLVAWSMVGDLLWLKRSPGGLKQKGTPDGGRALGWLKEETARVKAHLAKQGLKVVRTAEDVDRAVRGEPHVVLAVEGATFLDGNPDALEAAYALGVRHVQLVHYVRNDIGDFQTEAPRHHGLTKLGEDVVKRCNRLGMLVDLAHSTSAAVQRALALSSVPVVWSHSSVTRSRLPNWRMPIWQARQLTLEDAQAIAKGGGVVGLWPMRSDVGGTPASYADRLAEMADWLGEDHAGFGTDMNAIANAAVGSYADLQKVIRRWRQTKMSETRIHKLAIGNYARVLKQALAARRA